MGASPTWHTHGWGLGHVTAEELFLVVVVGAVEAAVLIVTPAAVVATLGDVLAAHEDDIVCSVVGLASVAVVVVGLAAAAVVVASLAPVAVVAVGLAAAAVVVAWATHLQNEQPSWSTNVVAVAPALQEHLVRRPSHVLRVELAGTAGLLVDGRGDGGGGLGVLVEASDSEMLRQVHLVQPLWSTSGTA